MGSHRRRIILVDAKTMTLEVSIKTFSLTVLLICVFLSSLSAEGPIRLPIKGKHRDCGIRNFNVTGDRTNHAYFGEFPWTVILYERRYAVKSKGEVLDYRCGGTLIHAQMVVTAAHCIKDKTKKYKIIAGDWDTYTTDEPLQHQERNVKYIIIHPDYKEEILFNDLAVLILEEPFEVANNVNAICLPEQESVMDGTLCYLSGWGRNYFDRDGNYSRYMKRVEVPVMSRSVCQEKYRNESLGQDFVLLPGVICAGGHYEDACYGDGGNPLVCRLLTHPYRYYVVGIVSWGIDCGGKKVPGVYTHVASYKPWISAQIEALKYHTYQYAY